MCKIVVAKIENEAGRREAYKIITAQYSELIKEKDGIGIYIQEGDKKPQVDRSLKEYKDTFLSLLAHLPNSGVVAVHTRTGTSGAKDETNVHFWDCGGRIFAHNGFAEKGGVGFKSDTELYHDMEFCRGCGTAKGGICRKHKKPYHSTLYNAGYFTQREGKCDSLQFLEAMPKAITKATLEEYITENYFQGLGFLYADGKHYFLIEKTTHLWNTKDFTMLFSYTPDRTYITQNYKTIAGIRCATDTKEQEFRYKTYTPVWGVYELK